MNGDEGGGVVNNTCQVASPTRSWHLIGQHEVSIAFDVGRHGTLHHSGEHYYLGMETGGISLCKGGEVATKDGSPAVVCSLRQGTHLSLGDILAFQYTTALLTGFHGYHDQMIFQPAKHSLIVARLYLLRPEAVVVVVATESRDADTYRVLCPTDDAVATLRVVLKAEHQLGQHLRIHGVLVLSPQRSRMSNVGSREMVSAHPGAIHDT